MLLPETFVSSLPAPPIAPPDVPVKVPPPDYVWPTDASRIVTSTFGEFRETHFHAGLDISTVNKSGYRVVAARDGFVSRISVSPVGYGKMLTVQHADGYTTFYAHLQKFNTSIEARVRSEQRKLGCYPVEIECPPIDFPVRKGDLIAFTGKTGEGPPHLHFEIRDTDQNPVNPVLFKGLGNTDTIPPTIQEVAVIPLGERSLVDGSMAVAVYTPKTVSDNYWNIPDTIRVTGEIGFGVLARDRANKSRYRRGAYKHQLFIDDSLVYTVRLDRLPGKSFHHIDLYYSRIQHNGGRKRFERMFVDSPNDLPFYEPKGEKSGIITSAYFTQGMHTFKIVTADPNNNCSTVAGRLLMNHPPGIRLDRTGKDLSVHVIDGSSIKRIYVSTKSFDDSRWTHTMALSGFAYRDSSIRIDPLAERSDIVRVIAENSWGTRSRPHFEFMRSPTNGGGSLLIEHIIEPEFVRVTLKTHGYLTGDPTVVVYEGSSRRSIETYAADLDTYTGTFRPLESYQGIRRLFAQADVNGKPLTAREEFEIYPIVRGQKGTLSLDNGNLKIMYDSLSVLKTVFLHIEKYDHEGEPIYYLLPDRVVLDRGFRASVRVQLPRAKRALLYSTTGSRRIVAVAQSNGDSVLTGGITRALGELKTFVDTVSPYVTGLRIRGESSRRPTISFHFDDDLSDIEYKELKTYIDGEVVIPEVDGEHHVASYQVDQPLTRGSHRVTIRLKDRMGNSKKVDQDFQVR
jgi:hypothetical protein